MSELTFEDIQKALDSWKDKEDFIVEKCDCGCTLSYRGVWNICDKCHANLVSDVDFQRAFEYGNHKGVTIV